MAENTNDEPAFPCHSSLPIVALQKIGALLPCCLLQAASGWL